MAMSGGQDGVNDAGWTDGGSRGPNRRTQELVDQIKSLPDTASRYSFIDALSSEDQAELFKGLSKLDRQKYDQHLDDTVGQQVRAANERRLIEARAGRATNLSDAVEVLFEKIDQLPPSHARWIRDMDQTASQFKSYTKYTPRQAAVIWSIYRQNFPC